MARVSKNQRRKFNKALKDGIKKIPAEKRYKQRMKLLSDYLLFTVAELEIEEGADPADFMDRVMADIQRYLESMGEANK